MLRILRRFDWYLVLPILPIIILGLLTMKSLGGNDYFFNRQLIWVSLGFIAMVGISFIDWRNLKSSVLVLALYAGGVGLLVLLALIGFATRGAQSWFYIGSAAVEPVEIVKFALIVLFAKYFSRRYVEMALYRHLFISFLYMIIPVALVLMQPDLGSASVLVAIWLGMVVFAGLSLRQLLFLSGGAVLAAALGWMFVLAPYQKDRITAFLNPESDPYGSGYHAIQAMIAVGSGGVFGKGVGYGTQSRLNFLPESETDFMFAAFAEEWGLIGVLILMISFGLLFIRIIQVSMRSPDNFSKLFGLGVSFLLISHIIIHIGMNVGLLPITGIGLPFMSYGGSFFLILMASIGVLQSIAMRSDSLKRYGNIDIGALS